MSERTAIDGAKKFLDRINSIIKRYDPELKSRAVEILLAAAFPHHSTHESRQKIDPKQSDPPDGGWQDIGQLYEAASPSTQEERALVVGYYFQFVRGEEELRAQQLNNALKNLGHGVGNITDAIQGNIDSQPALMRQTKKSGSSKQARKLYKVTEAGKHRVLDMIKATAR